MPDRIKAWRRVLVAGLLVLIAPSGVAAWAAETAPSPENEMAWVTGSPESDDLTVHVYFFLSSSCLHCAHAREFLETLQTDRPWLKVHTYPVDEPGHNQELYRAFLGMSDMEIAVVPAIFFCGQGGAGFDAPETTGTLIQHNLDACYAALLAQSGTRTTDKVEQPQTINVPFMGAVDPTDLSLPVLTIVLGTADAFNPCAFFVLLFLLSMLVHVRSRARMLLVGLIFVATSGLLYFAFMAAWLNLFLVLEGVRYVTLAAGLVAVMVAAFNIKDFFYFKQGATLSLSGASRQRLFGRMRSLLSAERLPALLLGTVTLAIAANTYELLCTSGLPLVYTRTLTLSDLSTTGYYFYVALYNIVYVIPLLVITLVFLVTLGRWKLTERGGRLLKLLSGLMMLGLGLVLLIAPALLDNPLTALGLIGLAVTLTGLAAFIVPKNRAGAAR